MNLLRLLLFFVLSLCIMSSCSMQQTTEKFINREIDSFSRGFIQNILTGDTSAVRKLDTRLINDSALSILNVLHRTLADKKLNQIRALGAQDRWLRSTKANDNYDIYSVIYEYEFEDAFILFTIVINKQSKPYTIVSFNANASKESFSKRAEFTFKNKTLKHYIVFAWIIAIPLFIIITVISVIKTPIRRKWAWILLVILLNVGVNFNWTTGLFQWRNIEVILLLATDIAYGSIYAPWDFTVAFPLGAVIFWYRRKKILARRLEYEELINMYATEQSTEIKPGVDEDPSST